MCCVHEARSKVGQGVRSSMGCGQGGWSRGGRGGWNRKFENRGGATSRELWSGRVRCALCVRSRPGQWRRRPGAETHQAYMAVWTGGGRGGWRRGRAPQQRHKAAAQQGLEWQSHETERGAGGGSTGGATSTGGGQAGVVACGWGRCGGGGGKGTTAAKIAGGRPRCCCCCCWRWYGATIKGKEVSRHASEREVLVVQWWSEALGWRKRAGGRQKTTGRSKLGCVGEGGSGWVGLGCCCGRGGVMGRQLRKKWCW